MNMLCCYFVIANIKHSFYIKQANTLNKSFFNLLRRVFYHYISIKDIIMEKKEENDSQELCNDCKNLIGKGRYDPPHENLKKNRF